MRLASANGLCIIENAGGGARDDLGIARGLELYVRELILQLHGAGVRQVVVCNANAFMAAELKSLAIAVEFLRPGSRYSLAHAAGF